MSIRTGWMSPSDKLNSVPQAADIVDFMPYPKLRSWLATCKAEMPGYAELNDDGAKTFGDIFKQAKAKSS